MIDFHLHWVLAQAHEDMIKQISDAQINAMRQRYAEEVNRRLTETFFGGRAMPNQTALTEEVILAKRNPRKNPFGILNFEDVG